MEIVIIVSSQLLITTGSSSFKHNFTIHLVFATFHLPSPWDGGHLAFGIRQALSDNQLRITVSVTLVAWCFIDFEKNP